MYLNRSFPWRVIFRFSYRPFLRSIFWAVLVVFAYEYFDFKFLAVPFLPISMIGTALAFYLGMKNNSSYDRLWEARKIWGGIVNDSRAWASMLNSYVSNWQNSTVSEQNIQTQKEALANRHIAWIYAHKFNLRHKRMVWEHSRELHEEYRKKYQETFSINTQLEHDLMKYISKEELEQITKMANPATQLLNNQALAIRKLREQNIIEDFRLFEMQNHINKFFEHQGKNERIKTYPFPKQYSWMLNLYVVLFSLLVPFGLLTEMSKHGNVWLTIPFSAMLAWVFSFMEITSDYSENPFEGLAGDVPITNMARNIEIDMMQMLNIPNVPAPIVAHEGILM